MTELVVAIVADDLTGAMDAAAPFARRGARTRVVVAPEHLTEVLGQDDLPAVLAINTESRHLPANEASVRVATVFAALRPLAPHVLLKKIDSTLRGNVVAECLAARHSSRRGLLICPAVPAQGRTLYDGQVYVHGKPLAATDYGRDARAAAPVEPLPVLFAKEGLDLAVIAAAERPGTHEAVVDAAHESDLQILARELLDTPQRWLAVGAAGLSAAVAEALYPHADVSRLTTPPCDLRLIAVGSRCDQAHRQVACLGKAFPDLSVVYAVPGNGAGDRTPRLVANHRLVLPAGDPSCRFSPEQVAVAMARRVVELLDAAAPTQAPLLFLTGGDTAMATMRLMHVQHIELVDEWTPGVAWGWLDGDRRRPVMTKAGGFGDDALLVRLIEASTTRG